VGRALSQARFDFDWRRQFEPRARSETAQAMHDETLADDYFKTAEFCSMCGPKYCPMHNFPRRRLGRGARDDRTAQERGCGRPQGSMH